MTTGQTDIADRPLAFASPQPPARHGLRGIYLILAACILVPALGAVAWLALHHRAAPAQRTAPPPPSVTVATPLQRPVASSTEFTGQFSAVSQVELRAQVSGYLTEIHFTDGQLVKKGDLLFVIDPRPYDIALQQAVAQYQTAAANLDLANKEILRTTALHRDDFASTELLDQRLQAQENARAAIAQGEAAIHSAQLNLDFTRITAPFAGRVSLRRVSLGSLISGGLGATSSTVLTTVVSLDPVYLDFDMSEADYLQYQRFLSTRSAGSAPEIGVELGDEEHWPHQGKLDFIDNAIDRASGTLHARATVPNPDLLIAPGQFARLRVPMSLPRPELMVPEAALVTDQSRKLLMVVAADGSVVPKPVQLGALDDDGLRVITAGLAPTDQVIVNGLMRARPGAKVTPHVGVAPDGRH